MLLISEHFSFEVVINEVMSLLSDLIKLSATHYSRPCKKEVSSPQNFFILIKLMRKTNISTILAEVEKLIELT